MAKNNSKALPSDDNSITDAQHGTLITWVNESDDATANSRKNSEKARDYYDSKQLDASEIKSLNERGQASVVINRVKPKMDGLMGMEKSNKTTAKAYARTPKHTQGAQAATESIRFVLQDQDYGQIRSSAWDNLLMEGTAGVEVVVKKKNGEADIVLNHIQWDRLVYDPHSRRKDFSDAKYLGQVVWMDYQDALDLHPNAKDVLDTMVNGSSTYDDKPNWMDNTRKRVKIVELYWKDGRNVKYACFTRGGYCQAPIVSTYKNEDNETVWPYEFASMFIDREGNRYGACLQLLDVQDEINKRRSKALHLMSVRQTFGTKGAVEDLNAARAQLAKPDGHVEFGFGEFGKDFGILPTGDMAQSQFNLLEEAKREIDAVSYNAAAAGKETRNMSGVALRSREAASQTELAPMFDVLKNLDIRVYRKIWNNVKQYWKEEKWVRVTDDENNLKWVGLNKPMTQGEMLLKQAQAQGAPPEALQQIQMKIQQDPMMQQVTSTENDVVSLDVDIIIADAPDSVTTQIEDFQVIGEMVKSGFPMPPEAVIEASPLSNKEKILKMMKEQPQLSPEHQKQMEEMQGQLEEAGKQVQQLGQENQSLKSGQQEAQAKLQLSQQEGQAKLQLSMEEAKATLAIQKEKQDAEIQLAREKASADIDLKRQIAEADYQIEDRKMAMQNEYKMKEMNFKEECRVKDEQGQEAMTVLPQMTEALQNLAGLSQVFASIEAALIKSNEIQQSALEGQVKVLEAIERPKSVSIEGIRRDSTGKAVGATVSTTLQ